MATARIVNHVGRPVANHVLRGMPRSVPPSSTSTSSDASRTHHSDDKWTSPTRPSSSGITAPIQSTTSQHNIPESVLTLIRYNVTVPAALVIKGLDWKYVLTPGILPQVFHEDAKRDYERIRMFQEKGYDLEPTHAKRIFENFDMWRMLVIPQNVIHSTADKDTENALKELTQDNDVDSASNLEKKIAKVYEKFKAGDMEGARLLAERVHRRAMQFNDQVEQCRRIWELEKEKHHNFLSSLKWAAMSLFGATMVLPYCNKDEGFTMAGMVVRQLFIEWLQGPKCPDYLAQVERIKLHQTKMIIEMDETLDSALFS